MYISYVSRSNENHIPQNHYYIVDIFSDFWGVRSILYNFQVHC